MNSTSRERPASIAFGGVGGIPVASTKASKRSIKNPFRRQDASSTSSSNPTFTPPASNPPPAYATLPSSKSSTAPTKQRAASLFSWKSGKMSWGGFSSLRGKSDPDKEDQRLHPELPSSADRLKSTWKRRQNRHGVLDFEVFHPPFIVELDDVVPPPSSLGSDQAPSVIPPRSTFTPSPVPPVSPRSSRSEALSSAPVSLQRTAAPTSSAPSRLPRISETPKQQPQSIQGASGAQPSPELSRTAFSNQFPLPPARRPSSAELVVVANSIGPTKTLLSPPRTLPPKRYTSSGLPRPKNPPTVSGTLLPSRRLATPSPSIASTRSASSSTGGSGSSAATATRRPTSQTSVRKPISIPARPRSSPRLAAIATVAPGGTVEEGGSGGGVRNSWDSETTAATAPTRSSSASEDTVEGGGGGPAGSSPIDLKHRTLLVVPISHESTRPATAEVVAESGKGETRSESERIRAGEVITDDERERFEREVEAMFSEDRMKDLLVQLGI